MCYWKLCSKAAGRTLSIIFLVKKLFFTPQRHNLIFVKTYNCLVVKRSSLLFHTIKTHTGLSQIWMESKSADYIENVFMYCVFVQSFDSSKNKSANECKYKRR